MKMRTLYRIEAACNKEGKGGSHQQLAETVQRLIDDGWEILGTPFGGFDIMYQALQKKGPVPVLPMTAEK
jgi:hypothetical protein